MTRRMLKAREAPVASQMHRTRWRALVTAVLADAADLSTLRHLWRPCSQACPFPEGQFYRGSPFDRFSRIASEWHLKDAAWRAGQEAAFEELARQCLAVLDAPTRPVRSDIYG